MTAFLITIGLSYLLGSIPFGYLLVRWFRGEDVRGTGSGNIGATNVARSSPMLGAATLLLDALKGALAVVLARTLYPGPDPDRMLLPFVAALFAKALGWLGALKATPAMPVQASALPLDGAATRAVLAVVQAEPRCGGAHQRYRAPAGARHGGVDDPGHRGAAKRSQSDREC